MLLMEYQKERYIPWMFGIDIIVVVSRIDIIKKCLLYMIEMLPEFWVSLGFWRLSSYDCLGSGYQKVISTVTCKSAWTTDWQQGRKLTERS